MMQDIETTKSGPSSFVVRFFAIILVATLFLLIWKAGDVLFLIFAGILLATFLQLLALKLSSALPISYTIALTLIIVIFIVTLISFVLLLSPTLFIQMSELLTSLPKAIVYLQSIVEGYLQAGVVSEEKMSIKDLMTSSFAILDRIPTIFSTTLGAIFSFGLVFLIGIYFAYDYTTYKTGVLSLIPKGKQVPIERVLEACVSSLRQWLLGQFVSMGFVAAATMTGLWILQAPFAVTLGLLAGVFTFLPAIGSFLAAIPAVLLALVQGPTLAFYVILLYSLVHILEGYFITPYIQKRTTSLPPALVIIAQVLLTVLAGPWGLVMAAPLLAVFLIIVDKIYIEEIVEKT